MKVESDRAPSPPSPPSPKAAKPKAPPSAKLKREPVWVVFFFAKDCQRCAAVKLLLRGLKDKKLLRLKVFDIDREKDYSLYRSLEAIHGDGAFAVPMVVVGDSILIGEIEIEEKLEGIVKRLHESGKGGLPYLGPPQGGKKPPAQKKRGSCPCEDKGRPPTVHQEWNKLKTVVGKWLDRDPR